MRWAAPMYLGTSFERMQSEWSPITTMGHLAGATLGLRISVGGEKHCKSCPLVRGQQGHTG
jgi:hypothetical protein